MIQNHSMLQKARTKLAIRDPFYSTILFGMKEVLTDTLPGGKPLWLAATDGQHLYINPTNFNALPLEEAIGVLKHECMHPALMHNWRRGTRTQQRWNTACDGVINNMIADEKGVLPVGGVNMPMAKGLTAEQVYAQLPEDPPGGGGGQGQQDPNSPPDNPMGDDVLDAPDQSPQAQAEMQQRIAQAAQVAKARGKMPAGLRELLDEVLNPRVDWKETLRRFLTEVSRADYSFARPNRRFIAQGGYLPGLHSDGAMRKLAVVIDTSGSVGETELKQFFGEVCGAIEETSPGQVVVVYCDAKVNHVDHFDAPSTAEVAASAKRVGGGGTDMPAALDWLDEHEPDVAATCVFTDGWTGYGEERPNVLWAITDPSKTSPWGETVHVDFSD